MMQELLPLDAIRERVERILRGEQIEAAAAIEAGTVPSYYGARTPAEIATLWLGWSETAADIDRTFYLSNAIGWASRG